MAIGTRATHDISVEDVEYLRTAPRRSCCGCSGARALDMIVELVHSRLR